jgi:hypothetical protein
MAGKPWTEERRAEHSRRMRRRWKGGEFANRKSPTIADAERERRSGRMRALNVRMLLDEKLKARNIRSVTKSRRRPDARAIASAVMTDRMQRPDMKASAAAHCRRPGASERTKKGWRTRHRRAAKATTCSEA